MLVKRKIENSTIEISINDDSIYHKIEEISNLDAENLYILFLKNIYDITRKIIEEFDVENIIVEENLKKRENITFSILFRNNKLINVNYSLKEIINDNKAISDIISVSIKDTILNSYMKGGI